MKLQIMSAREGHITMDTEAKEGSVEHATPEQIEARFNELIGKGFLGFTASAEGATGTMTREFDPTAAEMVMTPPMVGG